MMEVEHGCDFDNCRAEADHCYCEKHLEEMLLEAADDAVDISVALNS